MADIDTDRCESCGHPFADWCDDECCWWKAERALLPDADHSSDGSFRYPVKHTPGPVPNWTRDDQAAEDAKHAGEQWPPGNGWPPTAEMIRGAIARREAGRDGVQ